MPSRHPRSSSRIAVVALAVLSAVASPGGSQTIQIKTLPIAEGDQWRFFPSANTGMAGVSIALRDSLLDPFVNPALGSRVSASSHGSFFGSPTFYSLSRNAGGGQTFPIGGLLRKGSTFGGLAVALQEIDEINSGFTPTFPPNVRAVDGTVLVPETPSRQNRYAFATLGRVFESAKLSVGGSLMWSGLRNVDGVDLLYSGAAGINQHGSAFDARLGMLKEFRGNQTVEAIFLHNRFGMTHDVTWLDQVWDPNTRTFAQLARVDHNRDKTNTWGLHIAYSRPLADSGWRIGGIVTSNLMSHPKLPDYQITQVMVIPWDPGHSAAYNFGIGISKSHRATTFGIDAIFEPIHSHTWGEAHGPLQTASGGTIPDGGKTTENHFRFSNAVMRAGVGHDLLIHPDQKLRLQFGIALRSIDYSLDQYDHVTERPRQQDESWIEWTKTWGLGLHFSDLEIRYSGRRATGTGRPGIFAEQDFRVAAADALSGSNFISAPNGPISLTGVSVTTHQLSVSLPIR